MKHLHFAVISIFIVITNSAAQTYQNYIINTPNGSSVTASQLTSGELTSTQKLEAKNYWLNYYSNRITFVSEATRSYNCHAYAWYLTEGGTPNVWINTPGDDVFWNDGSYVLVPNASNATKVSFPDGDHSAITTNQTGILQSKWGQVPVFRHTISDCPYAQTNIKYYNKCTTNTIIQNTNYITNQLINGCIVTLTNVNVQNGAKLTIDATNAVFINPNFEVQVGSEFEIK